MKKSIITIGDMTDSADTATTLANSSDGLKPQQGDESVLLLLSGSVISKGQLYIKPESIHGTVLEASGYRNAISKGKTFHKWVLRSYSILILR